MNSRYRIIFFTTRAVDSAESTICIVVGNDAAQQRRDQRIVGAGQHQHISLLRRLRHRLAEIDARHLLGHGMLDPSFFHQRDKQRARLLVGLQPMLLQRIAISVAADRGFGGDDDGRAAAC